MFSGLYLQVVENRAESAGTDINIRELVSAEMHDQIVIRNYTGFDAELTDGKSFFDIPADGGAIIYCESDAEYNFSLSIETDEGTYFNEFDSHCGKKFAICEDWNDGGTEI
ncbi:Uncharacterized protein dnm_073070 [Desulfonema magnum]|uniref:Uncharacterized protein n=2 Tax=Desulfonema magnum TaxID=45655 RepID=A0A975GSM8_9BACT|nr:Uncharacterized protein dnm_073070 [Desulfonema magnum]